MVFIRNFVQLYTCVTLEFFSPINYAVALPVFRRYESGPWKITIYSCEDGLNIGVRLFGFS